ncbi:MAG: hypothetical protein HY901_29280 [Deltaproteobacteria bacterium]|nr:hypothetical protein [Deltaproteobacteria bacterium]
MSTSTWQVTSNTGKTGAMAVGCVVVGVLFLWLTRHAAVGDGDTAAAKWLGVLLAGIGLAGLLFMEEVVTTVDPAQRRLVIDRRMWWSRTQQVVPFNEIESVRVVKIGSRSDGTPSFWLQIERKHGRACATGRWSLSEAEIGQLAERLAAEVGCSRQGGAPSAPAPAAAIHLIAAALGAVALYALWFRMRVGPWCPAMWFGTAPPVFILASFGVLLGSLRRFWR